jgi:hypothetical protein
MRHAMLKFVRVLMASGPAFWMWLKCLTPKVFEQTPTFSSKQTPTFS